MKCNEKIYYSSPIRGVFISGPRAEDFQFAKSKKEILYYQFNTSGVYLIQNTLDDEAAEGLAISIIPSKNAERKGVRSSELHRSFTTGAKQPKFTGSKALFASFAKNNGISILRSGNRKL